MASVFKRGTKMQVAVTLNERRFALSVSALEDGLNQKKAQRQLLRLVEAMFTAAGVPIPGELAECPTLSTFGPTAIKSGALSTLSLREDVLKSLCVDLGTLRMNEIRPSQLQAWYDEECESRAPGTMGNRLSAASMIFQSAVDDGHCRMNPAKKVVPVENEAVVEKLPFTDEEIARLTHYILQSDDPVKGDWSRAILLGRHAGLSLSDAKNFKGSQVKKVGGMVVVTGKRKKTGEEFTVPILNLRAGDIFECLMDSEWFCSKLRTIPTPTLSKDFVELCDAAGLDRPTVEVNGKTMRQKTFHSLRHSFCTALASLGIPGEDRRRMSAHATESAAAGYDHSDIAALVARMKPFVKMP